MIRPYPAVSFCLLLLASSTPVFAQSVLDRVVGPTPWNQPLTLTQLNGENIGSLALAARVPMGIESNQRPVRANWSIPATGRPLRGVLDALIAVEPGYIWEEMDGLVVIRPVERASGDGDVLSIQIDRFQLRDVRSADAINALSVLFGAGWVAGPGDTRRFSVDMPDGSTIRDVLNAIVAAHGTLAWAFEYKQPVGAGERIPSTISLFIGSSGGTPVGISKNARIGGVPQSPVDVAPTGAPSLPILDRIVGSDRQGRPVSISVLNAPNVAALADASRTPMGVETTNSIRKMVPITRPTIVTGMRLADALATLAAMDGRYEWREMDGVIVFRPRQAWGDALDPLFLPVRDVQLQRVTLSTVLGLIASVLKSRDHATNYIADTKRISIEMPAGSLLDLLNAVAKSHGQLTWQFDEMSPGDQRSSGGRRHVVTLSIFGGGGYGIMVP
jgi:hypothetical protein